MLRELFLKSRVLTDVSFEMQSAKNRGNLKHKSGVFRILSKGHARYSINSMNICMRKALQREEKRCDIFPVDYTYTSSNNSCMFHLPLRYSRDKIRDTPPCKNTENRERVL